MYKNEKEVGEGIRASGVPREEIFVRQPFHCVFGALNLNAWQITSKLWSTFHSRVEECLDQTLSASALLPLTQSSSPLAGDLGVDYVDRTASSRSFPPDS
jgi:hypothetical protein